MKYNAKRVWFFIWFWLVFHPAWCCLFRTGGQGLLNRQNLLSVTKVICWWPLTTWYVSMSQWNIQQYLTYWCSLPSGIVSLKVIVRVWSMAMYLPIINPHLLLPGNDHFFWTNQNVLFTKSAITSECHNIFGWNKKHYFNEWLGQAMSHFQI